MKRNKLIQTDRTSLAPRLKSTAKREQVNARFDGSIVITSTSKPRLEAHTRMDNKQTEIGYADSYARENSSRVYGFVRDAGVHEINHHQHNGVVKGYKFKGCPRNLDLGTKLVYEPIYEILQPKGFSEGDASYLENALEDTILHSDLSPAYPLQGIGYFFEEAGSQEGRFTPLYEAHVKLNLALWGSNPQLKRLSKFFSKDKKETEKIDGVIQEFITNSGIAQLNAPLSFTKNPETCDARLKARQFLNDEKNWESISRAYAEAFSKLMTPNYAMPLINHSGAGTKGREREDSSKDGNEFQKQRQSKEYKIGRVQDAHGKQEGLPKWIEKFEGMNLFYQGLAKKLAIEVKTFTESSRMPISYYGEKPFNPITDRLSNISFGFDSQGGLELRTKPHSIDIQVPVKHSTIGFPKAKLVLIDTSGSMADDFAGGNDVGSKLIVPWGDKSKYHGALVEWYGFMEWLNENHLLERTGIDLVNFSSKTIRGNGLESAKKVALEPQFGNTKLDLSKVQDLFGEKGAFILTISDGAIDNWSSIGSQFLEGVKNHAYIHLQLGDENSVCRDIRKAGGHVECIRTADELRGRAIKIADKFYRGLN